MLFAIFSDPSSGAPPSPFMILKFDTFFGSPRVRMLPKSRLLNSLPRKTPHSKGEASGGFPRRASS